MKKNHTIFAVIIVILLLFSPLVTKAQSASFGNTFVHSSGEMVVFGQHDFDNSSTGLLPGIVGAERSPSEGLFSFASTASFINASTSNYVDGYVKVYGKSDFILPLGDNNKFAPMAYNASAVVSTIEAAYYRADPSIAVTSNLAGGNYPVLPIGGAFNTALFNGDISAVSEHEYWDINSSESLKITLTWDASSGIGSLTTNNLSNLAIVAWDGSEWIEIPSTIDATSILGGSSTFSTGSITTNSEFVPNIYNVYTLASVIAINTPPTALDDLENTLEETMVVIDVLVNDTDPDTTLNPATVSIVLAPANGTIGAINTTTGEISYTPNIDYVGPDVFQYQVCDFGIPLPQACDTAEVIVIVSAVNDTPTISHNPVVVQEDNTVSICPTISDVDNATSTLTLGISVAPSFGTLVASFPTGCYNYTPNLDYDGADSVVFYVCDPNGACDTLTIPITVVPNSDSPLAVDDFVTVAEDDSIIIDVLDNDLEGDTTFDPGSVTVIAPPASGTLSVDAVSGDITFLPNPNFCGSDQFTYLICDNGTPALCDSAIVYMTITCVNDTPTISHPPVVVSEDTLIEICPTINDIDNATSTLNTTLCVLPLNGTATETIPGCFNYIPNANFNGVDSFCISVCDNDGACAELTIAITIIPKNDKPIALDDAVSTLEETIVTIDVLVNDSDVDTTLNTASVIIVSGPANGTIGSINNTNGNIPYTPNINFVGTDTFTYSVCDNGIPLPALCDTAQVIITVLEVNDIPTITHPNIVVAEDSLFIICPIVDDVEDLSSLLTVGICQAPSNGNLVTSLSSGCYDYTPLPNYNGSDSVCMFVCDTDGACDTIVIPITVVAVSDAPIAVDDNATVSEDDSVVIIVLANDLEADTTINPASVTVISTPVSGGVSVNSTNGNVTYTPNPNFCGSDVFTYLVCDFATPTSCDTADVFVTIDCVNDTPTIVQTPVLVPEDTSIEICPTLNDVDDAVATLNTSLCALPSNGTVVETTPGCYEYTPTINYNGADSFCVSVCDNSGLCSQTIVLINVVPLSDAPIAVDDNVLLNEDDSLIINVVNNDIEVDTTIDVSSVTIITSVNFGSLSVNTTTGEVTYIPNPNFCGSDQFTYSVCDFSTPALCDTADVFITVDCVNDTPSISIPILPVEVLEDGSTTISPVINDIDNPSSTLSITLCSVPFNGIATGTTPGSFVYTPNANFNGTDSFCISVCDNLGACSELVVPIIISSVNDTPVIVANPTTILQDSVLVLCNTISDVDHTTPSLNVGTSNTTTPEGGTVTVGPGQCVTYTPAPFFFGTDTVCTFVCDPVGACDTVCSVITVIENNASYPDADGDLVPDAVEVADGTDPNDALDYLDSDGDLVPDYVETTLQPNTGGVATDAFDADDFIDTDNGGVADYVETVLFPNSGLTATDPLNTADDNQDTDGDGVTDAEEIADGTDPLDATDYIDTDGDLVPDAVEVAEGTDPNDATDYLDTDGDGVPDYVETTLQPNTGGLVSDPFDATDFTDTDNGGVPDYIEAVLLPNYGLSATDPLNTADDNQDTDGDGVSDADEILDGTDATDPTDYLDTDGDGVPDFVEDTQGTDS
ncbi:MAG: tandem-95 repeat protein, partial [Chitinophagales bacterium]